MAFFDIHSEFSFELLNFCELSAHFEVRYVIILGYQLILQLLHFSLQINYQQCIFIKILSCFIAISSDVCRFIKFFNELVTTLKLHRHLI
jgi:hypothetical protein